MPKHLPTNNNRIVVVNTPEEYADYKAVTESCIQKDTYKKYVEGLSHEQVVQKITDLVADNKVLQSKMSALKSEIEECEKTLNIKCTPENIVAYKNSLDESMRTALKTIQQAEEALLEESKDVPDDVRRKWFEDVINETSNVKSVGHESLK